MDNSTNSISKQDLSLKETVSIGSYAVVIVVLSWGLGFFWGKSHPEKFRWGTWFSFTKSAHTSPSTQSASLPPRADDSGNRTVDSTEKPKLDISKVQSAHEPASLLTKIVEKHRTQKLNFAPKETLDASLKSHTFVYLDQINLFRGQDNFEVSFGVRKLFPAGQATISQVAQLEFQFLVRAVAHFGKDAFIDVESYTDSTPVVKNRTLFPTNWELSGARASVIVNELISLGIPPQKIRIIGYGDGQSKSLSDSPTRSIASKSDPRMIRLRLSNKPF